MTEVKNDLNAPGRAVIQTAKIQNNGAEAIVLSTGVRARIKSVAASLLDKVSSGIPEVDVPVEFNEDKQRNEPNPLSPEYLAAKKARNKARGEAVIEAAIMFGVELLDPIPPLDEWMDKLKFLEKRGHLDLHEFDLEDPIELEYLYKSMIAVGPQDLQIVMASASIPTEALTRAAESFQREEKRATDTKSQSAR
jgi:hypothetical protein